MPISPADRRLRVQRLKLREIAVRYTHGCDTDTIDPREDDELRGAALGYAFALIDGVQEETRELVAKAMGGRS